MDRSSSSYRIECRPTVRRRRRSLRGTSSSDIPPSRHARAGEERPCPGDGHHGRGYPRSLGDACIRGKMRATPYTDHVRDPEAKVGDVVELDTYGKIEPTAIGDKGFMVDAYDRHSGYTLGRSCKQKDGRGDRRLHRGTHRTLPCARSRDPRSSAPTLRQSCMPCGAPPRRVPRRRYDGTHRAALAPTGWRYRAPSRYSR